MGISKSVDFGNNWIPLNEGLTNKYLNCLAILDNYMFTGAAKVFVSDNYGGNWTQIQGGPSDYSLKDITILNREVYAGVGYAGVFKSSDYGSSWTQVNTGLGLDEIITVLDTLNPYIFAGSESSVNVSSNGGESWMELNDGIMDGKEILSLCANNDILLAGTSTGIWKRTLSDLEGLGVHKPAAHRHVSLYPNPARSTLYIGGTAQFDGAKVYNLSGQLVYEEVLTDNQIHIEALPSGFYLLKLDNSSGIISKKFLKH